MDFLIEDTTVGTFFLWVVLIYSLLCLFVIFSKRISSIEKLILISLCVFVPVIGLLLSLIYIGTRKKKLA